jgi:hypothetical protein
MLGIFPIVSDSQFALEMIRKIPGVNKITI